MGKRVKKRIRLSLVISEAFNETAEEIDNLLDFSGIIETWEMETFEAIDAILVQIDVSHDYE